MRDPGAGVLSCARCGQRRKRGARLIGLRRWANDAGGFRAWFILGAAFGKDQMIRHIVSQLFPETVHFCLSEAIRCGEDEVDYQHGRVAR